jgi:hypothetical protein
MDDMVLGQLMRALGKPGVRSLTLAPGREAAVLHVRPGGEQGWVFTLECRPVMAGLLATAVAHGGGAPPTVLSRSGPPDGAVRVQLELEVGEARLASRVLRVFLRDHTRTRPDERLSAFVLEEGEPVATLLELYRPAATRSHTRTTLVVLPTVIHATS